MQLGMKAGALAHRDFSLWFVGQSISQIGSWMQSVGQSWLILQMTNSAWKLGLINTLQFAPMLVLALFAGALTDRLPKRKLIIFTQTAFMILAFVLAALVWTNRVQYWHVAVLALLLGLVNTLDMPARQAFVVDMVGKQDLASAVAMNSALFNGARIIGPAVAGIMIAKFGIAPAFFLNGISFIAVIAALFVMKAEGLPHTGPKKSVLNEIGEGVKYSWKTPMVLMLLALTLGVGLFVVNWGVLVPLLAKEVLHQNSEGYGGLMAVMGAGALVAALLKAAENRSDPSLQSIVVPGLLLSAATAAMILVHQVWLASVVLFLMGYTMILFFTGTNTKLQMNVPDRLRGRVLSLYTLANAGVTPFGSLITGGLAEKWGAGMGFFGDGLLGVLSVLALLIWWASGLRAKHLATETAGS